MPRPDPSAVAGASARVSAALAFVLLTAQMLLPWCVPLLITQDGPSHLYTATIARDLVFHGGALYGAVYHLQPLTNPNWATTVLLAGLSALAGVEHAEKLLMSLCLLGGFLAFRYASRAAWSPVANFVVQAWFLWIGYYNFYIGMVLCLFVAGFYLRHAAALTWPRALLIAVGGVGLALTHPVPAALTIVTLGTLALWAVIFNHQHWRTCMPAILALSPAIVLLMLFARRTHAPVHYMPDAWHSLKYFPMQAFATAGGTWGTQLWAWPVMLAAIVAGMLLMRREEWRGPRGALAVVAALCFAGYLLLPDEGFGGGEAKIRFAWATFLFGALMVTGVQRLRAWQLPLTMWLAVTLAVNLAVTLKTARGLSAVARDYLTATSAIPPGARFVRLRYHTPSIPWRYGFSGNFSDPLLHLDAYAAVTGRSVDLADWQPANPVFSVGLNRGLTDQGQALWSLESPFPDGSGTLRQLRQTLPIEYVVVVGEDTAEATRGTDFQQLLAELESSAHLVATSNHGFVGVYRGR